MRPLLFTCLLMFLPISPADGQSWGADDPPAPGVVTVPVEVDVVGDTSFATAAAAAAGRRGPTWRERADMKLLPRDIRATLRQLNAEGKLADMDVNTIAMVVLDRAMAENPKAFMDASSGTDEARGVWLDNLLKWLEAALPFILMFFSFMS